jgi:membrane protein
VSLGINAIVDAISDRLIALFPQIGVVVFYIINLIITFGITAFIFGIIFKVLPDATIKWKHVRAGAIATAILFMLGKFLISFYIGQGTVGSAFGAASSFIVLLTWVYYSALILYFGAEFTKFYALAYGDKIQPSAYAVSTKIVEIERDSMDTDGEKVVVRQGNNKEIEEKLEELPDETEDGLSTRNNIT